MKTALVCIMLAILVGGCAESGPAISKSDLGNLEINVRDANNHPVLQAEIYIDGIFIGNATERTPIVYAKRGERVVMVQAAGYKTYEKTITILGEPNHQVLNIYMEKVNGDKTTN